MNRVLPGSLGVWAEQGSGSIRFYLYDTSGDDSIQIIYYNAINNVFRVWDGDWNLNSNEELHE